MKIRKSPSIFVACLLLAGLFDGCSKKDPEPEIYYSEWVGFGAAGWSGTQIETLIAPQLTQEIVNKGTVLVYARSYFPQDLEEGNYTDLHQLPVTIATDGEVYMTLRYVAEKGKITLYASPPTSGWAYRYVLISPGKSVGNNEAAIDHSDYEAVKEAYNIPD